MEFIEIKESERIDYLDIKNYKIIQDKEGFCFGIDAVLLGNYVKGKEKDIVVDLGTGTGVIPLIVEGKQNVKKVYGIEIQEEVAEMAKRTITMNNLEEKIEIMNIDLKNVTDYIGIETVDIVTSNPPYMSVKEGFQNENERKSISRHEIKCNIDEVCKAASRLLKFHGKFYMIHRPSRLVDIFVAMRNNNVEPKRIKFVYPKLGKKPNLVLIQGTKGGSPEILTEEPLIVYNESGRYTDEILKIYGL